MVFHTGLIRRLIVPVVQLAEILSRPLLWENVYQRSAILFLSLFRLFQFPVIPVLFVQLTFYYPRRFGGRQNCTVKVKLLGNHSKCTVQQPIRNIRKTKWDQLWEYVPQETSFWLKTSWDNFLSEEERIPRAISLQLTSKAKAKKISCCHFKVEFIIKLEQ